MSAREFHPTYISVNTDDDVSTVGFMLSDLTDDIDENKCEIGVRIFRLLRQHQSRAAGSNEAHGICESMTVFIAWNWTLFSEDCLDPSGHVRGRANWGTLRQPHFDEKLIPRPRREKLRPDDG